MQLTSQVFSTFFVLGLPEDGQVGRNMLYWTSNDIKF